VFDTRTGLNNHSSKQHGYYYSLKGDCFVPLGGAVSATTLNRRPPQGVAALAPDSTRASAVEPDAPRGASGPRIPEVFHRSVIHEGSTTPSWHHKLCARVS